MTPGRRLRGAPSPISTNLDFAQKHGQRYIHGNSLGWIGLLVYDITTKFKVASQEG